jgi:hypothetical protein
VSGCQPWSNCGINNVFVSRRGRDCQSDCVSNVRSVYLQSRVCGLWDCVATGASVLCRACLGYAQIGVIYRKRSGGRARGARRRARGRLASPRTARRAARTLVSRVRLRDEFTSLTVLCQCVSSVSHCSPTGWSLDVASSRGHGSRHTHIATAPLTALLSCYQLCPLRYDRARIINIYVTAFTNGIFYLRYRRASRYPTGYVVHPRRV